MQEADAQGGDDQARRLLVHRVVEVAHPAGLGARLRFGQDAGVELGRTQTPEVLEHRHDFLLAHERPVQPHRPRRAGREVEHVAHAEQTLGALGVEDRPRVESRGDLEGDPAGEVRLDHAGETLTLGR
jgi:hypothetical protein